MQGKSPSSLDQINVPTVSVALQMPLQCALNEVTSYIQEVLSSRYQISVKIHTIILFQTGQMVAAVRTVLNNIKQK